VQRAHTDSRWTEGAMAKQKKKTALLVMGRECSKALAEILQQCGADVTLAGNCREARAALRRWPVDVVVSELSLDDGSWWTAKTRNCSGLSRQPFSPCLPHSDEGIRICSNLDVPPCEFRPTTRIQFAGSSKRRPLLAAVRKHSRPHTEQ